MAENTTKMVERIEVITKACCMLKEQLQTATIELNMQITGPNINATIRIRNSNVNFSMKHPGRRRRSCAQKLKSKQRLYNYMAEKNAVSVSKGRKLLHVAL